MAVEATSIQLFRSLKVQIEYYFQPGMSRQKMDSIEATFKYDSP